MAKKKQVKAITISMTERVAEALDKACTQYSAEPEYIASDALEEWLRRRGFIS